MSATCTVGTLRWFKNETLTTEFFNTKVSPISSSSYWAICSNGICPSQSVKIDLIINQKPTIPDISADSIQNVCPNLFVDLTLLTSIPADQTYEWHNANDNTASTLVTNPKQVTTSGSYYVLAKNNTTGCKSQLSIPKIVIIDSNCTSPDTFTTYVGTGGTTTQLCVDNTQVGSISGFAYCDGSPIHTFGTSNDDFTNGESCFTYTAGNVAGVDTFCVIITGTNELTDTTTFIITVIKTDTISVTGLPGTPTSPLCPTADDIFTVKSKTVTVCNATGTPTHGTVTTNANGCAIYTPFTNNSGGKDTLCVIGIDSLGRRDTTVFIVTTPAGVITPDTISVTGLPGTPTSPLCPTADDIFTVKSKTVTVCNATGTPTHGTVTTDANGCAIYTPFTNNPGGKDTLCVIGIDSLGRRDTTVFVITTPAGVITPDTISVTGLPGTPTSPLCPTADDIFTVKSKTVTVCNATGTPTHGTVTTDANGCAIYTPFTNNSGGKDTLCVIGIDSLGRRDTTVFVITNLESPNTTDAVNDINQTYKNTPISGNLHSNDTDKEEDEIFVTTLVVDLDGDGLVDDTITVNSSTTVYGIDSSGNSIPAGTLIVNSNGTYTFTPNANFVGTVPARYTNTDNNKFPATDNATLTIEVRDNEPDVNDAPIANDDTNTTEEGVAITSNVLTPNDHDPDGDPIQVSGFVVDTDGDGIPETPVLVGSLIQIGGIDQYGNSITNAGTLQIFSNGEYVFRPTSGFIGQIVASYTIVDPEGKSDSATLTIDIKPKKENHTYANDDANLGLEGATQMGNILSNDNDPEGDNQIVSSATDATGANIPIGTFVTLPSGGKIKINPDGSYVYNPAPGFIGTEVIPYAISDIFGATSKATLYLTTLPLGSTPCKPTICIPISIRKVNK